MTQHGALLLRGASAALVMPVCFAILAAFRDKRTRLGLLAVTFVLASQVVAPGTVGALVCMLGGVGGFLGSGVVARFCAETWKYAQPQVLDAPFWLIPLWACVLLVFRVVLFLPSDAGACSLRLTVECDQGSGRAESHSPALSAILRA